MSFTISKVIYTPMGLIKITSSIEGIEKLTLIDEDSFSKKNIEKYSTDEEPHDFSHGESVKKIINTAENLLHRYFKGEIKEFSLPINLKVTPFQREVLEAISRIPYGKTATYKEIGLSIGLNKGFRAIGNACNKNPLPLIIPCHRVVGSNGSLTGYAYGLANKKFLLQLEGCDMSLLKA